MNRQEAHTLTHYTDITETRRQNVRKLQAEAARSMLRLILAAITKPVRTFPKSASLSSLDQAGTAGVRK
jgi:hypothetical protein